MGEFVLSEKYKDFMRYDDATFEILEGTTASGKTTTGIIKFMLKVAKSKSKAHIISGQNVGVIEKNIINSELGILDVFGDYVEYHAKGRGNNTLAHIIYKTAKGEKTIYILGYDNGSRWKNALGGQYGCVYIDEINTADMAYVRQVAMRCDYLMGTLNPDDPDKAIYKEYINRCRPIEKYAKSAPPQLLDMLNEDPTDGWVWWYFSFDDNLGLPEEKKRKIRSSHTPGTADYMHYILGLRGKSEGVVFDNFVPKLHCIKYSDIKPYLDTGANEHFVVYSAGLDTSYSKNSDDTVAMSYIAITNKGRMFVLDEEILNNKWEKQSFAPSDIAQKFVQFLEKNRNAFGFAHNVYVDSADQATITELSKLKRQTGSVYNFVPSYKQLKIIDRIQLQKGWIATGTMFIVDKCVAYIKVLLIYSWSDSLNKVVPEDGNDHMINSVQYAWIPYKNRIGDTVK